MNKYFFIILVNTIFCLGVESIALPQNALEIASANSGIADSKNIGFNFSNINNLKNGFNLSSIAWYQDVKGGNIEYKWGQENHHYLSLYNLSADDIDLRYLTPSDEPIDIFDIHHVSIAYGFGKNFNNYKMGAKASINYNQLYTDESLGYNIDIGMSYKYNNFISLGVAINQLGAEKIAGSFISYPVQAGLGLTLDLNRLNSQFHSDIIYNDSFSDEITLRLSSKTKISSLNIITGYNHSKSKSEFSCGLSFEYRKFQFNYGVAFHQALGTPVIFSLKYHI